MNTVQDASSVSALFGAGAPKPASGSTDETKDRFLSLLVAQMKNQDPLNPLDNAQVTSQLAQLSTVQGIETVNSNLQALAASLGPNQMAQAATLIGHGVLVPGDSVGPAQIDDVMGVELARPADTVRLTVMDVAGAAVRTLDLGPREAGTTVLAWDGLTDSGAAAPAGTYRFKIDAAQGGEPVDATALHLGRVDSISQTSQGVRLNLATGGQAAYAEIRQIF